VRHRPQPEGWDPEAPFHVVGGFEAAMTKAQDLAGDRIVEVAAGTSVARYSSQVWSTKSAWTSYRDRVLHLRDRVRR